MAEQKLRWPRYARVADDGLIVGVMQTDGDAPEGFVDLGDWGGFEERPAPGLAPYFVDGAVEWRDPRPLEDVRAAAWQAIKQRRQELDAAPIAVDDFALDGDSSSRQDLMGAIMAMQLTGQTTRAWRCADNAMRELTLAQLIAAGTGIADRRQALIETSDALYQQIQTATTAAEVSAITWPASPSA